MNAPGPVGSTKIPAIDPTGKLNPETKAPVAQVTRGVSAIGAKIGSPTSSVISTPEGPITWFRATDGSVHAQGGGQTFTSTYTEQPGGSWQSSAVYSKSVPPVVPGTQITSTGTSVYFVTELAVNVDAGSVETSLIVGFSRVTLAITDIDAGGTSGTATVSGILAGVTVNWTGPVDLTSNPFVGQPVPGWPKGAFSAEIQEAAFFAPVAEATAHTAASAGAVTRGVAGGVHAEDKGVVNSGIGVLGRAGAWCLGGAIAGSIGAMASGPAAPVDAGPAIVGGCIGGATASILADLSDWLNQPDVPFTVPTITVPMDPEPTDPTTQTSTDGSTGPTFPDDPGDPSDGTEGDGEGEAGCFVAGTSVHTGDGDRVAIEEVALDSKLASCDILTGVVSVGTVTRRFDATSAEIVTIVFAGEVLRCTPRHRFYTTSEWMPAGRLSAGIEVRCIDGATRKVLEVSREPAETAVFNLRVDRQHTYYVGEAGYLVHNAKDANVDDGQVGDDLGDDRDKD
jgi:Pretoxin HINT domain